MGVLLAVAASLFVLCAATGCQRGPADDARVGDEPPETAPTMPPQKYAFDVAEHDASTTHHAHFDCTE
ncbi:MAG: hypothetical protein KC417_06435 [Myxococcales bacterium]|nr:hypothetical protein [Myxococcales bacterium]